MAMFKYPEATTPESIEAFRTMYGQTPEDDVRLGGVFETFLKGFVAGRVSVYERLAVLESKMDMLEELNGRVENLEGFRDSTANYDSYGNYSRLVG